MEPSSFIGVIWDAAKCFCGCVQKEADFVFDLGKNLKLLEDKTKKLEEMKKDVEEQIEEANQNNPEVKISHQLSGWRQRVEAIQQEIEAFEVQGAQEIQNKCLSNWCPKNCRSSYELGKNVAKMLEDVDELATEGKNFGNRNFIVSHKVVPRAIEMRQDEVVGLDLMFNEVWNCIEEENVGIIEPNLNSIMDNIRKLVGIGDDFWNRSSNLDEKAAKIDGALKHKKFILLLDDIWDRLDLKLVGVPHPKDTNFQSKVLFTTRLENVCAKMLVQKKFKVEILTEKEALELFCMKVGEETLNSHPTIPRLAEKLAKECKGLPLALIVLGSSMAGVKSVGAWEHSINNLPSSSWTGPHLEEKVFSVLKYSYDKLDAIQKRCLLYFALYPEDYEILVSDLIDKWMGEKFLCKDMTMSVEDIRGHGESVIEKLKLSCLLESVDDDFFVARTVKMHDVIRDMALWLLQEDHDNIELVKRILITNDWESQKKGWEIPLGVLSSLQQLRVFRLPFGFFISELEERRILEELECLPNIEELWITIKTSDGLDKLSESTKLQSCLYYFSAMFFSYAPKPLLSLGFMSGLKKLHHIFLDSLNIRSDLYPFMVETCWLAKLQMVEIYSCQVTHVTWLKYAPLLQRLKIDGCKSMEEVIKEEEAVKDENVDSSLVFSSLVQLILHHLPILESIHRAPLPFPSLKSVAIHKCPKLEKLPFDFKSAELKLTLIQGQQNWWDSLKWDDPTAKNKFQSKFKSFVHYWEGVKGKYVNSADRLADGDEHVSFLIV
ncbi:hypothetical protein K1719_021150 [Acacia pycnantha]|nr:hypothetical protein K1719_021150 [Acacia pycnantha]